VTEERRTFTTLVDVFKRVGEKVPRSPKEMGSLRLRLVQAGYRREEAVTIFFGIRVVFALALFGLFSTSIVFKPNLMLAMGGVGFGYIFPGMVLARLAKKRAHKIRLSLADALDLLVVSVEAGLGLDQALTRVGQELAFAYPDLSDELRLVNLELRAGKARSDALRNLAERTGVEDLNSLVTMLIQTDKFGTSVAQALRVYSDTLRTKRRQRAEEAAAKTGVKMVFPLVLCIFPAIWVVTIGPAAIKFITVLLPTFEK
jgi:tight adherence protein C